MGPNKESMLFSKSSLSAPYRINISRIMTTSSLKALIIGTPLWREHMERWGKDWAVKMLQQLWMYQTVMWRTSHAEHYEMG
jgi:hypothetical protein